MPDFNEKQQLIRCTKGSVSKKRFNRRGFLAKTAVTSAAAGAGLRGVTFWAKPMIVMIALPAHAQTSAVAAGTCSDLSYALSSVSTPSGSQCTVEFQILSTGNQVEIRSVTANNTSDTVITNTGPATTSNGPLITWSGLSADPFTCLPATDVTFTVDYNCAQNAGVVQTSVTLFSLLA